MENNLLNTINTPLEAGDRFTITTSNGGRITGTLYTSIPEGFGGPGVTTLTLHEVDGVGNPRATHPISTSRVTGLYRA